MPGDGVQKATAHIRNMDFFQNTTAKEMRIQVYVHLLAAVMRMRIYFHSRKFLSTIWYTERHILTHCVRKTAYMHVFASSRVQSHFYLSSVPHALHKFFKLDKSANCCYVAAATSPPTIINILLPYTILCDATMNLFIYILLVRAMCLHIKNAPRIW